MREFRRRRKEYARLKYNHQYFMALHGDTIVDATERGNDSRFINHSCEPNSETQKVGDQLFTSCSAEIRGICRVGGETFITFLCICFFLFYCLLLFTYASYQKICGW